jgi:hypothetical protein
MMSGLFIPEVVHEHYLKVPVCIRQEYIIMLEQHISGTFAHCDMFKWNKSSRASFLKDWNLVATTHGGPIYALHDFHDRKHNKWLFMCGFKRFKILPNLKEIWIWSNNG